MTTYHLIYSRGNELKDNITHPYSEQFFSFQGEGKYTGVPTLWHRFFLCNLQCQGFGQIDPKDESTYKLPYLEVNPDDYEKLTDLPVFAYGCDSSYSWSKRFARFQTHATPEESVDSLLKLLDPKVDTSLIDLCFTGGEPLMSRAQTSSVAMMKVLDKRGIKVNRVTYETNATQRLNEAFKDYWDQSYTPVFFSMSPKLYCVSGEKPEKAIKPEIIVDYIEETLVKDPSFEPHDYQLKFVVSGSEESWDEMEGVLTKIRNEMDKRRTIGGFDPSKVWIMPLGGTTEGQSGSISGHMSAADIAIETINRGYKFAARVHTHVFGNAIGL